MFIIFTVHHHTVKNQKCQIYVVHDGKQPMSVNKLFFWQNGYWKHFSDKTVNNQTCDFMLYLTNCCEIILSKCVYFTSCFYGSVSTTVSGVQWLVIFHSRQWWPTTVTKKTLSFFRSSRSLSLTLFCRLSGEVTENTFLSIKKTKSVA